MRQDTTNAAGKLGGCAQAPPSLDPSLLAFEDDHTFVSAGHLVLTVTYPSTSTPGKRYIFCVRDDGTLITTGDHDDHCPDFREASRCPGFRRYGACLHTRGTAEMVREYWRRHFRRLPRTDVLREDNFLAHCPAASLDAAQQLQWDAVGDVVAERFAARRGAAA